MKLALVAGALFLSACAATAPSPPAQFSKNGCTVDFKKTCQYVIDQPGFALNSFAGGIAGYRPSSLSGLQYSSTEAHSAHHLEVPVSLGGSGAVMRCMIDTRTNSATEGSLDPSYPPLDDSNIEHLREKGLCQ
jgi:hypothetical protein